MNVAQWLNAIDLGQYEALFREHEIDADVLPDLVEADLEKIGVPLGHRKRLMRAIAALSAGGTPPSAAKPASAQPSPSPPTSVTEAERRPITVMFCDLVGSTTISAALDAEDWRNLVSAYLDAASEAVTQMGGRVAKKLGDGLMALFGHPIAQENDFERAVRAALAIQRALAELNRKNTTRAGRSSSPASALRPERSWSIRPENVRRRAQYRREGAALADPGTVLITARVQRQVAGLFVAEDKGAHDLKGMPAQFSAADDLDELAFAFMGATRSSAKASLPSPFITVLTDVVELLRDCKHQRRSTDSWQVCRDRLGPTWRGRRDAPKKRAAEPPDAGIWGNLISGEDRRAQQSGKVNAARRRTSALPRIQQATP